VEYFVKPKKENIQEEATSFVKEEKAKERPYYLNRELFKTRYIDLKMDK
jgi:hypothetical protein